MRERGSNVNKGLLFILGTALISGVSIFLNAFGVSGLNPFAFTGMKNLIVAIFLISVILLATRARELRSLSLKQWGYLSLIGLIGGSVPFLLFFKGLSMGSGAAGAFMHKTMILWVTLGALLFLKERMNWKIILGAAALLVGNFLLLKLSGIALSEGLVYTFIAALLWSGEVLVSKHMLKDFSGSTVAFGRMGIGAAIILVFLMVSGRLTSVLSWSANAWGWVLMTSLFLLGYVWTFYNGLKLVNASTAVAVLSLGSVITSVLQLAFLGKAFTPGQIVGLVLLAVGVAVFWWLQRGLSWAGPIKA
ncbi:DMT family transporter [Candidatus Woesearchaeota archaeon]|nr:DMT family transporter [Candidatus Woesearchaeota archaeon]